mgnify:CR=1
MIASYSSNVAILVHDLMLARGIARQTSVHAIDVQGRVYCGCGASFCMEMEQRAKKEPSRGTKSMVEIFKGSIINNLKFQPLPPATARTVPAKPGNLQPLRPATARTVPAKTKTKTGMHYRFKFGRLLPVRANT